MSYEDKHVPWPKMTRLDPTMSTITEKINGTNAAVRIRGGEVVAAQSRNRFITPHDDNFGFARWVQDNASELALLGDGLHFGEWVGEGIQGNPHGCLRRHWLLFDVARWCYQGVTPSGGVAVSKKADLPRCCGTVPVLAWRVPVSGSFIEETLKRLVERGCYAEGIVVWNHTFDAATKHTIDSPNGKWCKD